MPTISVRLFAGLREMVGAREVDVDVQEGATVGDVRERLAEDYPVIRPFLRTLVCAVDEEYVPSGYVLQPGQSVALIPPVSGG